MIHYEKPDLTKELVDELLHYGMPRRSGRYPYGSGKDPYQHSGDFYSRVQELRKQNFTFTDKDGKTWTGDNAIAKSMGLTSGQFRTRYGVAKDEQRMLNAARAKSLKEDGLGATEIGRIMGASESTVRSWLNEDSAVRMQKSKATADFLKKRVAEVGMLDVGLGVEKELNITETKLNQALEMLQMEGYHVYGGRIPQPTNPKQMTTLKVLCPPGTEHKDIFKYEIGSVKEYITRDDGDTFEKKFVYPKSMDSSRLMIRYADDVGPDGVKGIQKDGIIELRRGVDDLDLKGSRYAQVRILVDNDRYLKGMAVYSDDLPDGVDVVFNTNKTKDVPMRKVLKEIKKDPDNPFGSNIKEREKGGQYTYIDKDGNKQLGLINKTREEGDWEEWSDKLPSQFLSKQSQALAKRQLGIALKEKTDEYNSIMEVTNPTVKKKLLQDFSDGCDSAALHLHAAALPRQKHQVIIPMNSLKDDEIYAPRYNHGEKVALVRYPHGGTFEIPIVTVNNNHAIAKKLLGTDITDAVGINSNVAERLSGADFDGDTVMVIPTNDKVKIKSTKPLEGLVGFDPKIEYGTKEGPDGEYYNAAGNKIKVMKNTQNEMGRISNLITDMTLQGASPDELARAVRHSMVVIDAEKHKLDYKKSYEDNGIASLKKDYQEGGASTLISRAKREYQVPKRQGSPKVNLKGKSWYDPSRPEGAYIWTQAEDLEYEVTKTNRKTGKVTTKIKTRTQPSTEMAETDDARTLMSKMNTPMEQIYADYANRMKAMANTARKEMMVAGKIPYDKKAREIYAKEVKSLNDKLDIAMLNKPRERQAIIIATSRVKAKKKDNPDMTKEELKKINQQEMARARELVNAKRHPIEIDDREWEAIQSGAITETVLRNIMQYADIDVLRSKATPKTTTTLSSSKINRINSMRASGLTISQIANALGVSASTVSKHLSGKE